MKNILPLILLSLFVSMPAMAAETPAGAQSSPAEVQASPEQIALSKKMHEIWPIRSRIEGAIDSVSQKFPADKRAQVKAAMRKSIQFDQVEEESIQAMATTFTVEELQAMIDFYGSETGRSISAKTQDYEEALQPVMMKMMDKAMIELKTGLRQ